MNTVKVLSASCVLCTLAACPSDTEPDVVPSSQDSGARDVGAGLDAEADLMTSDAGSSGVDAARDVNGPNEPNEPPTAPVLSIRPEQPTTWSDLKAILETPSTDPDGDPVMYRWEWRESGVLRETDLSASLIQAVDSSQTARDQVWTLRATPTDGRLDGPAAEASVTILNSRPFVETVAVQSARPFANDFECPGSAWDVDGDAFELERVWTLDGQVLPGETSFAASIDVVKGQLVVCELTANDGDARSAPKASSLSIANAAPRILSIDVTPANPRSNEDLRCDAVATDLDGDDELEPLEFEWLKNTEAIPGQTGPTLTADQTSPGNAYTCRVTARDVVPESTTDDSALVFVLP